jgi:hypothetical protein
LTSRMRAYLQVDCLHCSKGSSPQKSRSVRSGKRDLDGLAAQKAISLRGIASETAPEIFQCDALAGD